MQCNPVVAVVLPAYNAERYLTEAVNSVIQQTFQDWELILVDDCSSDNTSVIAQRFAAQDNRIHVIRNEVNQREAGSRNRGIAAVSSIVRYIATMDADDCCRPERLAKQVAFMEAHPEISVCGSSIALMDENSCIFAQRNYPCGSVEILKKYCRFNCFAHPTTMFRREVFNMLKYDIKHRCVDYDLIFRLLENHNGGNLPEILLDYRISTTQQKSRYLKETLLDSVKIQKTRLLKKRFFSPLNLLCWLAEIGLLFLPDSWIFWLFRKKYFKKDKQ